MTKLKQSPVNLLEHDNTGTLLYKTVVVMVTSKCILADPLLLNKSVTD